MVVVWTLLVWPLGRVGHFFLNPTLLGPVGLGQGQGANPTPGSSFVEPMPRTQANFVALAFAYLILSYLCASPIGLARHVTSRGRVGRVGHSARILRPPHHVGLGNLPDPRVRVGRANPIELKPDPTVTLDSSTRTIMYWGLTISLASFFNCTLSRWINTI